MITETRGTIDFSTFPSSDGEPMAETEANLDQMIDLILTLRQPLARLGHHVGGNLLIYWDPRDGWKHISPDVFVALNSGPARRESWKTWLEGKFPEVVIEVASPSTQNTDIGSKVRMYGHLGAHEYYIFDPARRLQPAFRGFAARDGVMRPLPNPSGDSMTSPLLGLEFRVVDGWLRVIDPATDRPYPTSEEQQEARKAAERHAAQEEQARHDEAAARIAAEVRAANAEHARQEAEVALQEALAMIARLRGDDVPAG